jgi:hypothetical protein
VYQKPARFCCPLKVIDELGDGFSDFGTVNVHAWSCWPGIGEPPLGCESHSANILFIKIYNIIYEYVKEILPRPG